MFIFMFMFIFHKKLRIMGKHFLRFYFSSNFKKKSEPQKGKCHHQNVMSIYIKRKGINVSLNKTFL
ncbi:hypothetical protein PFHG_02675 [Plasmodium falciparum HB3]|uniref:Uncharacterized protein n=2 Tax=Plasmodium falciparum TaxID=5833 RepID=A0A0L7M8K9_PLAF4|nr:hypothetical protein PFHG_02675 [Plasmodium falciparum HB3]KOB89138.1 hypothetical protein PFDG_04411 [Plasmodium falciparum Dd2]